MDRNVFSGEKALQTYLNPDNHPPLPLVELPSALNPYREKGIRVFLKLMHFLPLGNVKSLPAYSMLEEAERSGTLRGVEALVESSSGNTVLSLAVLGRAFGVSKTLALASHQVEHGKLQLLRFLGTEVRIIEENICPDPSDPKSGINQAKQMARDARWFNAGQYDNSANPAAHERWTGPQIWLQTEGKITLLAAGLGTTGTLCGTRAYLKAKNSKIRALGVVREPNNPVPGVRTKTLLNQVSFDWQSAADDLVSVGTKEAYEASLALCRAGLLVGPSSGFAVRGLMTHLSCLDSVELDGIRNEDGEVIAVVVAPDSPLPYIEEYFRYLGADAFPRIENEHLLTHAASSMPEPGEVPADDVDLRAEELLETGYGMSMEELSLLCAKGEEVPAQTPYLIIDVRGAYEFRDYHLPGSDHVDYGMLLRGLKTSFIPAWRAAGLTPVFVCSYGGKSSAIAVAVRKCGLEAWSLKGGTLGWSRQGYPRIKSSQCAR